MDDLTKTSEPQPPRESYESPRLEDLGDVHLLTRIVTSSPLDDK